MQQTEVTTKEEPLDRAAEKRKRATKATMKWLETLTDEERKEYYRKKMRAYRAKKPHKVAETMARWKAKNPNYAQAVTCQHNVKKNFPLAFESTDITRDELIGWIGTHKGQPCRLCGDPATWIEHKIPLARGGEHKWYNLEMLCEACNRSKSARTEDEFVAHARKIVAQAERRLNDGEWG